MAPLARIELRLTRKALRHLNEIQRFLRERNWQAAEKLADKLEATFDLLEKRPLIGRPGQSPDTREFSVSGFPYLIVYEVETATNAVIVHGVYHTARGDRNG